MKELKNLVSKIELNSDQEKQHITPKIKSSRKRKRKVIPRGEFESNANSHVFLLCQLWIVKSSSTISVMKTKKLLFLLS